MTYKHFMPILLLYAVLFIALPQNSVAQQPQNMPDGTVSSATRASVIENLIREMNDGYVFPDVAKKMQADLEKRRSAGEYDSITSSQAFAGKLTEDLQAISKDKHFRVRFSPEPIPVRRERAEPTKEEIEQMQSMMRRTNYGFDRVERLDGNIGYVEMRGFSDHEFGASTVAAAMAFLANSDALIFDLRQNGGGSPFMVALVSSYLFGDKPVHLNDLYFRKADRTDQFWTKPELAKVKFTDRDIYVLTSSRTFSGAEEFTYNLKNLKRATIIGETTGGGANPGGMVRLSDHFGAFIPMGRAINPITKTNWEGTGVEPDIKVPANQALKTAYLMAVNKSFAAETNENYKRQLKEVIDRLEKELEDMKRTSKSN